MIFKNIPLTVIEEIKNINLIELLVKAQVCSSKRQAREDVKNGIIFINDKVWKDSEMIIRQEDSFIINI